MLDKVKEKLPAGWPVIVVWLGILFCSNSSTLVRIGTAPSLVLAAYRKTIVTLLLLPAVLLHHRDEWKQMGGRKILMCIVSGFFLALHFYSYFESVKTTTIAASQVLAGSEVLFVAVVMYLSGKERYNKLAIAGICMAMCGSVLVAYTGSASTAQTSLSGNLLGLLSGAFLAAYSLIGTRVRATCSNTMYTFLAYGFSAVTLDIFLGVSEYPMFGWGWRNVAVAFGMAILCSLLGHSLFNWSLKYLSPTHVSMIKIFQPVLATLWGVLFFLEIPAWNQIFGGVVVILGILMYTSQKSR